MMQVDTPAAVGAFHRDDLAMLHTLAAIAAIKIDNAMLVEERLDNERMRQELASAREIQARLLPETPPALPGYEVAGATLPCGEVGGDYFDFLELGGGVLLFALGDVTGKGLDAALLMSSVHASIHTLVAAGTGAAELVERLNRFLCVNLPDNRFVTLFLAELDPASHRLRYFNAGHNPPLLVRRAGDLEPLPSASLPLGIDPTSVCQPTEVELEPGDVLLVYSDGVTEAVNEAGEEFGSAPLVELPRTYPTAQAWELQQLVDDRLRTFMGNQPQADDMTLVVLRRRPSA
jgi:serine phosphatase RsbU (regulator of sigma subunit)